MRKLRIPLVTSQSREVKPNDNERRQARDLKQQGKTLREDIARGVTPEQIIINQGNRNQFYNTSEEVLRDMGLVK